MGAGGGQSGPPPTSCCNPSRNRCSPQWLGEQIARLRTLHHGHQLTTIDTVESPGLLAAMQVTLGAISPDKLNVQQFARLIGQHHPSDPAGKFSPPSRIKVLLIVACGHPALGRE